MIYERNIEKVTFNTFNSFQRDSRVRMSDHSRIGERSLIFAIRSSINLRNETRLYHIRDGKRNVAVEIYLRNIGVTGD